MNHRNGPVFVNVLKVDINLTANIVFGTIAVFIFTTKN